MTPHALKIKQAKARQKAALESQTITIDAHWKILRADERNWQIQKDGSEQGFFGTLRAALTALPDKMLDQAAKGTLKDVLQSQMEIIETIRKSVG